MSRKHIPTSLVYPGADFDVFGNDNNKRENILGGLFSTRHITKRHVDVIKIGKRLGYEVLLLNRDIKNPTPKALREFYNKVKVWVSPSELEGLHNCPLEAGICGSTLVVTNHRRGGVLDYSRHNDTALVYPARKLEIAQEHVETLMTDDELRMRISSSMQTLLADKIGTREHNMKKMAKIFERNRN